MKNESLTNRIAEFIAGTEITDLSQEVLHAAKRSLLDWVGVALAGSHHESTNILIGVLNRGIGGEAKIIGIDSKTDMLNSAMINAFMSHVHDYDDTHIGSMVHASAPVWSPILALSNRKPVTGKDALLAFVIGFESEICIGMALRPVMVERGFHSTGVVGGIGAAAAIGKLLRLDTTQLRYALGIAASYGSGLRAMVGSMSKSLHPGKAAESGLFAALLAEQGFTSAADVFDVHPKGFFKYNANHPGFDNLDILSGLGKTYEIMNNSFKPYSSGIVSHPIIDCAVDIHNDYNINIDEIAHVTMDVNFMALHATGKKEPQSGLEGKFSIYHCVAAALTGGTCGPAQFTDERVKDKKTAKLRSKIDANINEAFTMTEARITVEMQDGTKLEKHKLCPRGSDSEPLSDKDLEQKFQENASMVLPGEEVGKLIDLIWNIETMDNINGIFQLI